MEKKQNFSADWWKVIVSKREQEIVADNDMWLTHPNHLNANKKRIVAQC